MIQAHKTINNFFGSGMFHYLHYIFKSKSYGFPNRNIVLFSVNDTRMGGIYGNAQRFVHEKISSYGNLFIIMWQYDH